jgi:hypothetical protein
VTAVLWDESMNIDSKLILVDSRKKYFNDTFCCGYRYAAFEIQQHHFNIWNRKRIQNVLHHVASTNAANAVSNYVFKHQTMVLLATAGTP